MAGELFVIFGPLLSRRHTSLPVAASMASKLPCNVVTNSSVLVPAAVLTLGNSAGALSTIPGSVCCQMRVRPPMVLGVRIVSAVFIPLREPPPSKAGQGMGAVLTVGVTVGVGVIDIGVGVSVPTCDFPIGVAFPPPDEQAARRIKSREINLMAPASRMAPARGATTNLREPSGPWLVVAGFAPAMLAAKL